MWDHRFSFPPYWRKKMRKSLILASASPRRYDLLTRLGVDFTVEISGIDETALTLKGPPAAQAVASANAKARAVADRFLNRWVLGADTMVVLEGEIFGKPGDKHEAAGMLRRLSGQTHGVVTGIALCKREDGAWEEWTDHEETLVRMGALTDGDIEAYVNSGEPMDKAGAYGIQDKGAFLVQGLEGCYFNVVGLPLRKTGLLLLKAGIPLWRGALI
jgi:septum formation protein